jgi:hypothetical protein
MTSKNFLSLGMLGIIAVSFTACEKDDAPETSSSFRPKMEYTTLSATSNYFETFKDANGATTVDFSGQTTRQDMLAEIDSVMRIATGSHASKGVPAAAVSASLLKNMYANSGSPFRTASLNAATDKQLKGKTAASLSAVEVENERKRFESWFEKVAAASTSFDKTASDGQAGIATANNGTSKYLVDEKGIEYAQLIQKGMIGAVLMDQIVNVYLGSEKQSLDNSKPVEGKNYTAREHSWDEAYGYLTKNAVYPTKDAANKWQERYLGNYVRPVGDPAQLFLAYLKGRAAIVNDDNTTREAQVALIRQHIEKALGTFAVSYLNNTKKELANNNPAAAMHAFGEGAGFVYALRFANNAKINAAKSETLLNKLIGGPKGFYSLTSATIDEVRNEIAAAFSIDPTTVASH